MTLTTAVTGPLRIYSRPWFVVTLSSRFAAKTTRTKVASSPRLLPVFRTMATSVAATSQNVTLPFISELQNPDFLDVLLPLKEAATSDSPSRDVVIPHNPMIDALKETSNRTLTANGSPAFDSTGNSALDAFNVLRPFCDASDMTDHLARSWQDDPAFTLRIIWNLRSIHDGKGEKELFYK